jgi:hypothetical protein
VVLGYCAWRKKPIRPILVTSICANFITQFLLWGVLKFFFEHYLIALLISEIFIWIAESLALYYVRANQLRFTDAVFLSLGMNIVSFGLGWILPI